MIKELILENYQIHKKSHFKFSPGLNVLVGVSDHGKSSVIRAIKWVCHNTPRGIAFKNRSAGKKDDVKVTIITDEGSCLRMKRDETNGGCYVLNDDHDNPYKALRTDVPESVANFLKIAPYQIRGQHDPFFLLSESPGPVAAKLNKAAGLAMAASAGKSANQLVRAADGTVKALKESIAIKEEKLEQAEWVEAADGLLGKLEKYQTKLHEVELKKTGLEELLGSIERIQTTIKTIPDVKTMQVKVRALETLTDELRSSTRTEQDLSQCLRRQEALRKAIKEDQSREKTAAIQKLAEQALVLKKCVKKAKALTKLIENVGTLTDKKEAAAKKVDEYTLLLKTKMKGRCALCGQ